MIHATSGKHSFSQSQSIQFGADCAVRFIANYFSIDPITLTEVARLNGGYMDFLQLIDHLGKLDCDLGNETVSNTAVFAAASADIFLDVVCQSILQTRSSFLHYLRFTGRIAAQHFLHALGEDVQS